MLKSHTHVGCNVSEIQNQKDEHQAFQDTAKVNVSHSKCNRIFLSSLFSSTTGHIQLWDSAIKCRFFASSIVQSKLRLESWNN